VARGTSRNDVRSMLNQWQQQQRQVAAERVAGIKNIGDRQVMHWHLPYETAVMPDHAAMGRRSLSNFDKMVAPCAPAWPVGIFAGGS
jgi:DNA-binding transcriptional regulator YdaS (Cro superfamily)